jgi:hypothetical protein
VTPIRHACTGVESSSTQHDHNQGVNQRCNKVYHA